MVGKLLWHVPHLGVWKGCEGVTATYLIAGEIDDLLPAGLRPASVPAAGRELLGAPKKLARIGLAKECDLVQGTLERPSGKRLLTMTMKPVTRMPLDIFRTLMPSPTPIYSVRHLPPVGGRGGVTQLVCWWADIDPHTDARGEPTLYAGPASVTFDSPSVIDPVHRLAVGQMVSAIYLQFDMRMGVTAVVKEY